MNKPVSVKTNLVLDLTIFAAFLVVSNPRLTGNSIHEWLGISFAAAIITHLLFHWQWLVKITTEFFKKLFHESRLNYVVDALFFIAMTGVTFSGILISRDVLQIFGLQVNASQSWRMIHSLTANLTLLTLGIHVALHWKWITANISRYILTPVRNLLPSYPAADNGQMQTRTGSMVAEPIRIDKNK